MKLDFATIAKIGGRLKDIASGDRTLGPYTLRLSHDTSVSFGTDREPGYAYVDVKVADTSVAFKSWPLSDAVTAIVERFR